ncbi:MAG: hypothetical protein RSA01_01210 [Clostridium sp.]|uniref:hypothetical protein n=1 Tax=Clostridium sp. TaxID=1506 RepID=UPI002FC88906
MWGVIYVAHHVDEVNRIKDSLEDAGIISRTREVLKSKDKSGLIEILVMESDIPEAYEIISSI